MNLFSLRKIKTFQPRDNVGQILAYNGLDICQPHLASWACVSLQTWNFFFGEDVICWRWHAFYRECQSWPHLATCVFGETRYDLWEGVVSWRQHAFSRECPSWLHLASCALRTFGDTGFHTPLLVRKLLSSPHTFAGGWGLICNLP